MAADKPRWNRDRKKPHGLPLPHHRTYGSRIRRFGRSSRLASWKAYHPAIQPELHLLPRQRRFIPAIRLAPTGLAECNTAVPWQATSPLFQSPLGAPFGPSVVSVAALAYPGLRLSTLQRLTSVTWLPPVGSVSFAARRRAARRATPTS